MPVHVTFFFSFGTGLLAQLPGFCFHLVSFSSPCSHKENTNATLSCSHDLTGYVFLYLHNEHPFLSFCMFFNCPQKQFLLSAQYFCPQNLGCSEQKREVVAMYWEEFENGKYMGPSVRLPDQNVRMFIMFIWLCKTSFGNCSGSMQRSYQGMHWNECSPLLSSRKSLRSPSSLLVVCLAKLKTDLFPYFITKISTVHVLYIYCMIQIAIIAPIFSVVNTSL